MVKLCALVDGLITGLYFNFRMAAEYILLKNSVLKRGFSIGKAFLIAD